MGWSGHHALQLLAGVRVSLRSHSFLVSRPRVRLVGRPPVRWLARQLTVLFFRAPSWARARGVLSCCCGLRRVPFFALNPFFDRSYS